MMRTLGLQSIFYMTLLLCGSALASKTAAESADDPNTQPTIAVVDLLDKGPSVELAVLRTAFTEMLSGDLSQYQGIGVVERGRVEQFLRELHLQKGFTDAAAVQRAGQTLAAEYLLTGTFSGKDKTVSLDVSLFKVGKQEPILRWKQSGVVERLSDMQQELSAKVLKTLGIDKPLRRPPPKPKSGLSPLVAVLVLRNLSTTAKLDPMQSGFADILQANLGALKDVRLVERKKLYVILKEQKLTISGLVDAATALKVGKLLGAERLIYGSFVQINGNLHLTIRLVDTKTTKILAAETTHGPLDNFADLIEDVSLRLAADLSIEPQTNAAQLVEAATPTRKLEAALHLATGERFFHQGRFEDSAKAFERVLAVDPKNGQASGKRVCAWYTQGKYVRAIEAGEQAIQTNTIPRYRQLKANLYTSLLASYRQLGQYDKAIIIQQRYDTEFPINRQTRRRLIGRVNLLRDGKDYDAASAILEQNIQTAKANGDDHSYIVALQVYHEHLLWGHQYCSKILRDNKESTYVKKVSDISKTLAVKSLETLDVILKVAEENPGEIWRHWAESVVVDAVNPTWLDEKRTVRRIYQEGSPEIAERLLRVLHEFSWIPKIHWNGMLMLAQQYETSHKWAEAIQAYRYVCKQANTIQPHGLPDQWDQYYIGNQSVIDKAISARFRIAQIYLQHLGKRDEAVEEFRQLLQQYGVIHRYGPMLCTALNELKQDIDFPEKCALVWGGRTYAHRAWSKLLKPKGFTVHSVAHYYVSGAELAPYSLVILVRTGRIPYTPNEILALRNYVATGGSLLVVICPGWEHAQPGIHNPLLSFFGVDADGEMTVRASSTHIVEHPITNGTNKVMAKNAVNLTVPDQYALIQAGEQTVLAAMPYRHGRVVVASFGQWFVPDPDIWSPRFKHVGPHWTSQFPREDWPTEKPQNLHLPLLGTVLSWLVEPHKDFEFSQMRQLFAKAQLVNLKFQLQTVPNEALTKAMNSLVETVEPGTWKEEAIWAVGESSIVPLSYLNEGRKVPYHLKAYPRFPVPATNYYRRLIRDYPDSPLALYARWRLAYCKWNEAVDYTQFASHPIQNRSLLPEAISLFQDVRAPEGSYVWAWSNLYLAVAYFHQHDYEKALQNFKLVANRMGDGPEKSLAILNAGLCCERLNKRDEAIRYYKIALTIPDCCWKSPSKQIHWGPLNKYGRTETNSTNKRIMQKRLKALGVTKGKLGELNRRRSK